MFARVPAPRIGRRRLRQIALAALLVVTALPACAAERGFPFDQELMLDARPMRGSKRVPTLEIGPKGETSIEMWCNTVQAQIVVDADTIAILSGTKTEEQCAPERMRGDDDLLGALLQVTTWRREGDVLTLRGAKTLRFRTATH